MACAGDRRDPVDWRAGRLAKRATASGDREDVEAPCTYAVSTIWSRFDFNSPTRFANLISIQALYRLHSPAERHEG